MMMMNWRHIVDLF